MSSSRFNAVFTCALIASSLPAVARAKETCTREISGSADGALSSFDKRTRDESVKANLWPEFQAAVAKYGACDDGAVAEMLAEVSIDMLRYRWEEAQTFAPLQNEGPFRSFVIRHVGATSLPEDLRAVRRNATRRCGRRSKAFCREVARRCSDAITEINTVIGK
jgi:hypothetical protein